MTLPDFPDFDQIIEELTNPQPFPQLPDPELVDIVGEDGEEVRFISVRSLVGMTDVVLQVLQRIGTPDDPKTLGQIELIEVLQSDYKEMTTYDPNFV